MKTNKELAEILADKISTPIYDALCELHNADAERRENKTPETLTRQEIVINNIEDVLNKINDYKQFNVLDPKTLDYDYIEDTIRNEYTDGQIEIYNYWLWKHAPILSDYIEDAMNEYGITDIKDGGLIKLFQYGEGYFYNQFFFEVLNALKEYHEESAQ